ncbi:MAG: M13 family peptidase, partial [Prevotella sp.]|nr:M13 family peptidase [Prevotella sp.]
MKKHLMVALLMVIPAMLMAQGLSRADMNETVKPGDDFYEYAGGGWMKANPLTAEYSSYGVFHHLNEQNRKQLQELFTSLGKEKQVKGSNGQKVIDLYNLAVDSVRLNKEGTTPLKADLDMVRSFKKSDLTNFLVKMHLALGNPFFGIGVSADMINSKMNV